MTDPGKPRGFIRSLTTGEFEPVKAQPLKLSTEDFRDRCAILQRELRTSQRWTTGYRRMALLGWIAFTAALLWQPQAHAQALPGDCEKLAAFKQNNAKHLQLDYMRLRVPPAQWAAFLKSSDELLQQRYEAQLAACKEVRP